MTVFCVVVSYNNMKMTQRAVKALEAQTIPVNYIVWDNCSTDGTRAWLERSPEIRSELCDLNLLWTPAVNAAINKHYNDEDFIVWMNNDAAPTPHCFERLVDLFNNDDTAGLVAPVMERIGGQQDVASCPAVHKLRGGDSDHRLKGLPPKRVSFVLGACTMIRRKAWVESGPLDESMPLGADDFAISIQVKENGYTIWVCQEGYCAHGGHVSASNPEGKAMWDEWGGKSWASFNEKYAGYYHSETEAIRCMWDGRWFPGWDVGTGWLDPDARGRIEEERAALEKAHPELFHGEA